MDTYNAWKSATLKLTTFAGYLADHGLPVHPDDMATLQERVRAEREAWALWVAYDSKGGDDE